MQAARRWLLTLSALLLWLGAATPASATIYYVNNVTGADSLPCSKATSTSGSNPMRTINYAINTCGGPGHTVRIMSTGTLYRDFVSNNESNVNWPTGTSWSAGGFFTVEGDPSGPRPILSPVSQGGKTGFAVTYTNQTGNGQLAQYNVINYVEVDGNSPGDNPNFVGSVLLYWTAEHLKITNSKFHNASNIIISGGARDAFNSTLDTTFQFNEVYDARIFLDTGTWPQPGCKALCSNPDGCPCGVGNYCMYVSPANSLIADNVLHDCTAWAIHLVHVHNQDLIFGNTITRNLIYRSSTNDSQRGLGADSLVDYGHDDVISNNIFYSINNPRVTGCQGVITSNGNNNLIYNNTIADSPNCMGVYIRGGNGSIVRGNILYNTSVATYIETSTGATATISNNYTSFPTFVDPGAGNYHLQASSLAKANCPNLFAAGVTVDIDGEARPSSGSFDCGADQLAGPPATPTKSQLEFGIQPSDSLSTATITPLVTVRVEASDGQLITDATDAITLSLVSTQIPRASLSVVSTDSAQAGWPGTNAIDGDTSTAWHTDFSGTPGQPHNIVLSFPSSTVNGLVYTPRLGPDTSGQVVGYNVYVSTDCATWGTAVATGSFGLQAGGKRYGISTTPKVGTCLKFETTSAKSGQPYSSAAELSVLAASSVVPTGTLTQNAVGGIATFTLAVPTAGTAYVLKATSGTLNSQLSAPFTITDAGGGGPPPGIEPATLLKYVPGR